MNFDAIIFPAPKRSYSIHDLAKLLYIPKQFKHMFEQKPLKFKN